MPNEQMQFKARSEILSFEEITRLVRVAVSLGVNQLRITGGEPLVRADLPQLIRMLSQVSGVQDLAMTSNGILLAENDMATRLRDAGLERLNISLDAMTEETFVRIARRPGVDRVLRGIEAARKAGFSKIRLNAVAIRGMTESEVVPLATFARDAHLELRFIEFMPLDAEQNWQSTQVLTGAEIRETLQRQFGPLRPADRPDPSQPAVDYLYADGQGSVGFINPVSEPFCGTCNRLRITAEGQLRNCLFATEEWDARRLLRGDASDDDLARLMCDCVAAKKPGHGIDSPEFLRPGRSMYQLGG
jgi:cyclic pyranopterin phosphate synthase